MITKRIIPCLDVKNGRVVKGVNFEGLHDVSSPVELARYYSEHGADELVFYDITASAEGRALFTDILREVVRNDLCLYLRPAYDSLRPCLNRRRDNRENT